MSYSVRERDRRTSYDDRGDDRDRSNITVRRYHVPDRDDDRWETGTHLSTRSKKNDDNYRSSSNVREYRFERDVERPAARESRDYDYSYNRDTRDSYRDSRDYRDTRDRGDTRDFKFTYESNRDHSPEPQREYRRNDDYEVERYTKTTDYYADPPPQQQQAPIYIRNDAPQPIIIRESAPQPVFIREERPREDRLEVKEQERERSTTRSEHHSVHESSYNQERQVARREDPPEEDYYYQRTTREIAKRDDDRDVRRGREVQPRDSASNNASDEEYYYKETEEWDEHRDRSPHHRRHLAEGAVLGGGVAALMRSHSKKSGGKAGGVGRVAGGAALGAVGAELVTRARSAYRERSKSRGARGRERDDGDRDDRARSSSPPASGYLNGHLGKLGAVAAVGALAGYALQNRNKKKGDDRRSRSRRRRSSRGRDRSRSRSRSSSADAHSGNKKKATMAKAGLASAAVAGLVERARSKSRGGKDTRSKSKARQAIPMAAAGLGGAALAGLYESNKDKMKERRHAARSQSRGASRSRSRGGSRSRSRARSDADRSRGAPGDDQNLIEYGGGSVAPDAAQSRRRGSPGSSDSGDGRRHRNRDVAGVDAHDAAERRERRQAERNQRAPQDDPMQQPAYGFGPYAQAVPEAPPAGDYPPGPYFPGPQNNQFQPVQNAYSPVPNFVDQGQYNSASFNQQSAYPPPPQPDQNYGYQQPPPPQGGYAPGDPNRRGYNVSSPSTVPENTGSGLNTQRTPRAPSSAPSPDRQQRSRSVHFLPTPTVFDGSAQTDPDDRVEDEGRGSRVDRGIRRQRSHSEPREQPSRRDQRHRTDSPGSDGSEDTVELPDRFDSEGRKKPERGSDPLTDRFEEMLHGDGINRLLSGLFESDSHSRHRGRR